jgi:3D (Asp-Asp-Asp) domain-containing protein
MSLFGVIVLVAGGAAMTASVRSAATALPASPIAVEPSVVTATLRLDGALVRGAARDWALNHTGPLRYGDPVPVQLTAYCLKGTTRRDRYVRQGIVAADPRVFPLGRYIEVYVGRKYYGRFLVDDTGDRIKHAILDIWTPTCRDARLFGRQHGTAVLVPRPRGAAADTLLTGRLGGAEDDSSR